MLVTQLEDLDALLHSELAFGLFGGRDGFSTHGTAKRPLNVIISLSFFAWWSRTLRGGVRTKFDFLGVGRV